MDYKAYMEKELTADPKRIKHVLGVKKRALEFAEIYNADKEVLTIAALLHDVTKNKSKDFHLNIIKDKKYLKNTPETLWHAKSAKIIAKELGITNKKILQAIEYHVFGKVNMELETLILVLSDYTEENRTHNGAIEVYNKALYSLEEAYLLMVEKTISHLNEMNKAIAKEQFDVYNNIKRGIKDK